MCTQETILQKSKIFKLLNILYLQNKTPRICWNRVFKLKLKNESLLRSEDCVGNGFAIDETQLRSEKTCLDNRLLQI